MANLAVQLTVTTSASLLWQTSTGVPPDVAVAPGSQIFRAGTQSDPVPIVIENTDASNAIYIGGSTVTTSNGVKLPAGGSLTYNVVGNDSLYGVSGGSVVVGVSVGRQ